MREGAGGGGGGVILINLAASNTEVKETTKAERRKITLLASRPTGALSLRAAGKGGHWVQTSSYEYGYP